MESSANTSNMQYQFNNIQELLTVQLEKVRQQSPESFSKPIYTLPAISDNIEYQLEQYLEQEQKDHNGERIILIPYSLSDSHWTGILIDFQSDDQILRAEYINPVNGFDVIPDRLQKQFAKVYPFAVLRSRNLLKHHDQRFSATLTVKNLLEALKYEQYPNSNPKPHQSHNSTRDENKTMTYSTENTSLKWVEEDTTIVTSTIHGPNEGETGSGKSTTIQFLAGATMRKIQVKVGPEKYLDHITAVGCFKNPELNNVTSSPLQKSETRCIAPVTTQLRDVLGTHESGEMIFCDAPGFGDTTGPEVDIANSIGVIEAIKGTKSVKLLALSSYKSLGDRGQGIQKLAHILIAMVHGIEDKLDAIFYAFTKYPEETDINALLVNIKTAKVDEDVTFKSDTAFVTVLNDMIDKTEDDAFKIEPTREIPKKNGDNALEYMKILVNDMDTLRTIPELETKCAGTYYHTIENIRGYMQQLQGEAEKLVIAIDQQSGITNYRHIARSLARLKNASWIDQISPGIYDNVMRRITEELVQYACQLEDSFMKVDFSLKCPENVSIAKEIVDKIESMQDLERSIPELEKYRNCILQRFLRCTQEAFDRIQKTFNLQDKDLYQIKQKLKELEEIKREYSNLHPARIYLQKQGYSNINMLTNDIEELKVKRKLENDVLLAAQCDMESELRNLNSIVQNYMNLLSSSSTDQDVFQTLSSMIGLDFQNQSSQTDTYLRSLGYSCIESVYEKISDVKKNYRQKLQRIEDQNTELSLLLDRLESIKKEHDLLITTRHSPSEEASFLEGKGFNSYELLDNSIQEITRVINEQGRNQQSYHFNDRLNALTANNALIYIRQCEKVGHDRVRENAIDANENLRKYIREYGIFLKHEIITKFNYMHTVDDEKDPFLYSQDLEMRLQELLSFSRFSYVFECINGAEMIEDFHQKFLEFHRTLSSKMEEYKNPSKIKELRNQVIIAQALTCVDRFCANIFSGNGFAALYRQYQGEIHKECRIAYKTVLDHISKGDYANADMALSDIQDKPLNPRDKAQIQNDLHCSLNKLMKDTKSIANWLDGKIEREDNRSQITEIKEPRR
ncbi:unnamed protein product, partial [Rotaria sordida]